MIPLDRLDKWWPVLEESARCYLNEGEYKLFRAVPDDEKYAQLKDLLEKPIARFTTINEVYFRARWAEVLQAIHPQKELRLLEVASGDADMIPQTLHRTHPGGLYITANTNKKLTASLREKTRDLSVRVRVIEEDAARIGETIGQDQVDCIAFQHAVNDVIQAILCEREGVDTIDSDWMETLPRMIQILQSEIRNNTFEQHSKVPFLNLIQKLLLTLKKDGVMVMNHYLFQLDLDWGYPPDLFENMLPMVRVWMQELPGCKEVHFDGYEPNWWLFYQKL